MAASRLSAAITALAAACAADATLASLSATVSDGLPISADYSEALLVIGGTPDEQDTSAGTISQDWHDSGSGASPRRYETARISCYAAKSTGDVDLATTRAGAFALLAAVEAILRADHTLGLADVISAALTEATYSPMQYGDGTVVFVPFTVEIRSLI